MGWFDDVNKEMYNALRDEAKRKSYLDEMDDLLTNTYGHDYIKFDVKPERNRSPYFNENTIVGEVIEDDNQPEREPDGPTFNESLISERAREVRRQRALYEYSAYSGLLGRPYEGSSISYNL